MATATATGPVLAADVRALAIVTGRVGALVVRVRDLPNGAQVIAALHGGTVVQVLFGRSVVDSIEWLQVRLSNGQVGWVAGYLLTITLERPAGTDTTEAPGTEAATSTPEPATALPNSTGQAPPHTAPTATQLSSGPTATPSRTGTATNTPVTPPATATDTQAPTMQPTDTSAPQATATDTPAPTIQPSDTPNQSDTPQDSPSPTP